MKNQSKTIAEFLNLIKKELSISSDNYAQLNFLIGKFSKEHDHQSQQTFVDLNLLMALLYYNSGSFLSFKRYFSVAIEHSQKFKYRFQTVIDDLKVKEVNGKNLKTNSKFSENELKLLNILKSENLDKFALIERLYGANADVLLAENRLKNLIFRIRKKNKGLIVCHDGLFSLALSID